jgi:NADP-dependent 3-hydroxy acid dehydrogenase YdfG
MSKPLLGKTAIITGASSGIGRITAKLLAQDGVAVAVNARRKERLDVLASEIRTLGGKALAVEGDMSDQATIDQILERVLKWEDGGRKYDIVVVNAGRGLDKGILDSDESKWEELYRINALGAASLMRRAGRYMVERNSGDIVVVGSVAGKHISGVSGIYGSTKLAIASLAEGMRREVCGYGVRVSIVMPGIVRSEFHEVGGYGEEFANMTDSMGQLLDPQTVGESIRWLLALPPHVNVNEIEIRPTGQIFP